MEHASLGTYGTRPGQPLLPGEERTLAIHLGIDLAQSQDYTALVLCEVRERGRQSPAWGAPWHTETFYRVHDLQRLPHGISYAEQVRLIVAYLVVLYDKHKTGEVPYVPRLLYVDATGLGKPVVDLLREHLTDEPRTARDTLVPLVFRHGEKFDRWGGYVGKTYLISSLQALLAADRLDLPAGHELLDVLRREIADYRINIEPTTGMETLGGIGNHDDLVTALALSVVDDPANYRVGIGPSLWGGQWR